MASFLDMSPYPWHLDAARELHVTLTRLFPTVNAISFLVPQTGLPLAMLNVNNAPFYLWREVLDQLAPLGLVRTLVERAYDQHKKSPSGAYLEALLDEEPIVAEPRGANGEPAFRDGSDEVMVDEALLYHDDLTLPIGRVPWLISVLQKLQTLAPSVCRLTTSAPGVMQRGTAFRIANDWLLTNWHVVNFKDVRATQAIAEFGYEDDGKDGGLPSQSIACDVTTIEGSKDNDWAILKPSQPLPATIPILKLSEHATPVMNEAAFVIQHPGGDRKRVAYVRNQVTFIGDRVLHYLSDTNEGSSGSPVINEKGLLIGLHHAGGRPQEVAGKPPLVKNEGIRIPAVIEGLTKKQVQFA